MTPLISAWLQLLGCAVVIGVAGPMLTRAADQIAKARHLSRSWAGILLLSHATALPELVTGLSAAGLARDANLAVGNALGSCIFNLALVALLDVLSRSEGIFRRVEQGHILTAALGNVLICFVGMQLLIGRGVLDLRLGHVSVYTPVLIILYLLVLRAVFLREQGAGADAQDPSARERASLRKPLLRYLLSAGLILAVGTWLPFVGLKIADTMGWETSFVGTILLAATTSLPEIVVVFTALRMGAADLAVGDLLGSYLLNILIIGLADLVYTDGPLLAAVSPAHAASAFGAAMMAGLVIAGILNRPTYRVFGVVGWTSVSLIAIYLLISYAIFLLRM